MANWLQLCRHTIRAEFPEFETLQAFACFGLTGAPDDANKVAGNRRLNLSVGGADTSELCSLFVLFCCLNPKQTTHTQTQHTRNNNNTHSNKHNNTTHKQHNQLNKQTHTNNNKQQTQTNTHTNPPPAQTTNEKTYNQQQTTNNKITHNQQQTQQTTNQQTTTQGQPETSLSEEPNEAKPHRVPHRDFCCFGACHDLLKEQTNKLISLT
jgi:hypothetical protein